MTPTTTTKTVEETPKESPPPKKAVEMNEVLDQSTFDQILEMDDDDDRDFSKGIVYGFFDQAETTFEKMEKALEEKKLEELSSLGHFLKGSSATLGLSKVKEHCEKIQHYGSGKDETGTADEPDEETSLKNIKKTLTEVKKDYKEVEQVLRNFYGEEKKPSPVSSPSSK
ncbi:Hpt domain-containing protein [Aspergillus clavatus NRRL 1]|uniref:Phosphotransmitter protein Ypd1, putative n=1 Tax=Aspergillus clavatus (strain ATCC 1007 / CBS 513.65 / DSM 816 / NCTC 3887 / NRRL 1 / QM 1276 / 107) TaxID=344612 RepID=A1CHX2_ASPCL|nr:phosphotransmitter protein Ypd1, putative [Aspergillus clavatus NRRL 1]EAW10477.1 phosphotransmitter protein Ypd1, putative [Aspergillus clavatus NRRL 1]